MEYTGCSEHGKTRVRFPFVSMARFSCRFHVRRVKFNGEKLVESYFKVASATLYVINSYIHYKLFDIFKICVESLICLRDDEPKFSLTRHITRKLKINKKSRNI